MRHHKANRKFNRSKNQRVALVRGLAQAIVLDEKIMTTEAKAKEIRPKIEKLITRAKVDSLSNRRLLLAGFYNNETVVNKLITEIAPRYIDRAGGYTRITKLAQRKGDGSKMAVIELV